MTDSTSTQTSNHRIQDSFTLASGTTLKNRLVKAAMTERLGNAANEPTDAHSTLYERWAQGGIGLSITGNVLISRDHLEHPGNVAIQGEPSERALEQFRQWAKAGQTNGSKIIMQLSHAGRQTMKTMNEHPCAPSAIKVKLPGGKFGLPQAMTQEQIEQTIQDFAKAAKVAEDCGFDGVQIHAAHGYLISSFLSPLSNQRTDEWGGSLDNRARFLLQTIKSVKAATGPSFIVAVKLNSADFQRGGFSADDSVGTVKLLNPLGLDFLEVSGGNYEQPKLLGAEGLEPAFEQNVSASTKARESYFIQYAKQMLQVATMPLMLVGGLRSCKAMNEALQEGMALIGIGRPLCYDPSVNALLAGEQDSLPRWEKTLDQGLFTTTSRFAIFKMIAIFSMQAWFYYHIQQLSKTTMSPSTIKPFKAFLLGNKQEKAQTTAFKKQRSQSD